MTSTTPTIVLPRVVTARLAQRFYRLTMRVKAAWRELTRPVVPDVCISRESLSTLTSQEILAILRNGRMPRALEAAHIKRVTPA